MQARERLSKWIRRASAFLKFLIWSLSFSLSLSLPPRSPLLSLLLKSFRQQELVPCPSIEMSSDDSNPQLAAKDDYPKDNEKLALAEREDSIGGPSIDEGVDILGLQALDRALNLKMHIVNNVRDQKAPPLTELGF
jgi:hypothetical protein